METEQVMTSLSEAPANDCSSPGHQRPKSKKKGKAARVPMPVRSLTNEEYDVIFDAVSKRVKQEAENLKLEMAEYIKTEPDADDEPEHGTDLATDDDDDDKQHNKNNEAVSEQRSDDDVDNDDDVHHIKVETDDTQHQEDEAADVQHIKVETDDDMICGSDIDNWDRRNVEDCDDNTSWHSESEKKRPPMSNSSKSPVLKGNKSSVSKENKSPLSKVKREQEQSHTPNHGKVPKSFVSKPTCRDERRKHKTNLLGKHGSDKHKMEEKKQNVFQRVKKSSGEKESSCHKPVSQKQVSLREKMKEREIEDIGTWVQCGNQSCHKWRYLSDVADPLTLPKKWQCNMNSNDRFNSCDKPEEEYNEEDHIFTKYTEGSVVWARMDGYPWWPAMIEVDPDYDTYFEVYTSSMHPVRYHVVFFDDRVSRAWIRVASLLPYCDNPNEQTSSKMGKFKKEIMAAKKNADSALKYSIKQRIKRFGFAARYKGKWGYTPEVCREEKPRKVKKKESRSLQLTTTVTDDLSLLDDHTMDEIINNTESVLSSIEDMMDSLSHQHSDSDQDPEYELKYTNSAAKEWLEKRRAARKRRMHRDRSDDVVDKKLIHSTTDSSGKLCMQLDPDIFTMETSNDGSNNCNVVDNKNNTSKVNDSDMEDSCGHSALASCAGKNTPLKQQTKTKKSDRMAAGKKPVDKTTDSKDNQATKPEAEAKKKKTKKSSKKNEVSSDRKSDVDGMKDELNVKVQKKEKKKEKSGDPNSKEKSGTQDVSSKRPAATSSDQKQFEKFKKKNVTPGSSKAESTKSNMHKPSDSKLKGSDVAKTQNIVPTFGTSKKKVSKFVAPVVKTQEMGMKDKGQEEKKEKAKDSQDRKSGKNDICAKRRDEKIVSFNTTEHRTSNKDGNEDGVKTDGLKNNVTGSQAELKEKHKLKLKKNSDCKLEKVNLNADKPASSVADNGGVKREKETLKIDDSKTDDSKKKLKKSNVKNMDLSKTSKIIKDDSQDAKLMKGCPQTITENNPDSDTDDNTEDHSTCDQKSVYETNKKKKIEGTCSDLRTDSKNKSKKTNCSKNKDSNNDDDDNEELLEMNNNKYKKSSAKKRKLHSSQDRVNAADVDYEERKFKDQNTNITEEKMSDKLNASQNQDNHEDELSERGSTCKSMVKCKKKAEKRKLSSSQRHNCSDEDVTELDITNMKKGKCKKDAQSQNSDENEDILELRDTEKRGKGKNSSVGKQKRDSHSQSSDEEDCSVLCYDKQKENCKTNSRKQKLCNFQSQNSEEDENISELSDRKKMQRKNPSDGKQKLCNSLNQKSKDERKDIVLLSDGNKKTGFKKTSPTLCNSQSEKNDDKNMNDKNPKKKSDHKRISSTAVDRHWIQSQNDNENDDDKISDYTKSETRKLRSSQSQQETNEEQDILELNNGDKRKSGCKKSKTRKMRHSQSQKDKDDEEEILGLNDDSKKKSHYKKISKARTLRSSQSQEDTDDEEDILELNDQNKRKSEPKQIFETRKLCNSQEDTDEEEEILGLNDDTKKRSSSNKRKLRSSQSQEDTDDEEELNDNNKKKSLYKKVFQKRKLRSSQTQENTDDDDDDDDEEILKLNDNKKKSSSNARKLHSSQSQEDTDDDDDDDEEILKLNDNKKESSSNTRKLHSSQSQEDTDDDDDDDEEILKLNDNKKESSSNTRKLHSSQSQGDTDDDDEILKLNDDNKKKSSSNTRKLRSSQSQDNTDDDDDDDEILKLNDVNKNKSSSNTRKLRSSQSQQDNYDDDDQKLNDANRDQQCPDSDSLDLDLDIDLNLKCSDNKHEPVVTGEDSDPFELGEEE